MLGYKLETEYNLMQNKQKMKMLIAIPLGLLLFIGILLSQVLVPNSNPPAVADTTNTSEESSNGSADDSTQPVEIANPIIENIVQEQAPTGTENSANSNSGETSQSFTPTKGADGGNINTNTIVQDDNGGSNTDTVIGSFGGGGGGHHSSNSNNNNSGNGDGTENENNNSQQASPQFWIKVADTNAVGNPVTAYILTTYSGPGVAEFNGFHEPDCSVGLDVPCEVVSDNSASSPTYGGEIPTACEPCYEYQVTFSPDTFVKGENHITGVVMNSDDLIGTVGIDFTVQSLFVVPESPIGIIGLMISSIAGIAVYLKFVSRVHLPSLK